MTPIDTRSAGTLLALALALGLATPPPAGAGGFAPFAAQAQAPADVISQALVAGCPMPLEGSRFRFPWELC